MYRIVLLCFMLQVWTNSESYNTPKRLGVFIRGLCNALIATVFWP